MEHSSNVFEEMIVNCDGSEIDVKALQYENAPLPMFSIFDPNVTEFNASHW